MEKKKKSLSWLAVIIIFIVFWPLGIYFIWKKMRIDRDAAVKNSAILRVIGIIFLVLAAIMLTGIKSDTEVTIGSVLFFAICGGLIIWGSVSVKRSGENYKKFMDIVMNNNQTSIDAIASIIGMSYAKTAKGVQEMIDDGYFKGAYIDQTNREIVFPRKQQTVVNESMWNANATNTPPQQKTVVCPNCGGNNVINIDKVSECEFCGSPIQ